MFEIKGKFNTAVCYSETTDENAVGQIQAMCDSETFSGCKIRIMPDVHAGKGCTIGTTMTVADKVVPAMVGVDIGCGMETVRLAEREIDFEKLDRVIRGNIPSGRSVRQKAHALAGEIDLTQLKCRGHVCLERAEKSIGSLGGGNHFIEVDRDEEGNLYLVVHSGSRHLGCEVAEYYQNEGYNALLGKAGAQIREVIARLKAQGKTDEIQRTLEAMKRNAEPKTDIPKDMAYVEGALFDDYICDMKLVQRFASLNRLAMTKVIFRGMGWTEVERFTTVHNYIDTDSMILRKGAVSAEEGQLLLIPVNMRDGGLICVGKGNREWNCSAPHGAGRLMSRKAASESLSLEEYQREMAGIYSTCIAADTLDESPMAYKSMGEIVSQIAPTARIVRHIRPIYNFKAAE